LRGGTFLSRKTNQGGWDSVGTLIALLVIDGGTEPNPAIFSTKEKRVIEKVIRFKDLPYKPFRTKLYSVKELTAGYHFERRKRQDRLESDGASQGNRRCPNDGEIAASPTTTTPS